jgi:hypothetical protein
MKLDPYLQRFVPMGIGFCLTLVARASGRTHGGLLFASSVIVAQPGRLECELRQIRAKICPRARIVNSDAYMAGEPACRGVKNPQVLLLELDIAMAQREAVIAPF